MSVRSKICSVLTIDENLSFNYLLYLTRLTWFPESCSGPVQPCPRAWARVAVIWPAQPYQIAEHLGRPAVEGLGLLWDNNCQILGRRFEN